MIKLSPVLIIGGFFIVCVLLLWPSAIRQRAEVSVQQVRTNMEVVLGAARRAQQHHTTLGREDVVHLLARLEWPVGTVSYKPRLFGVVGKPHWAILADPDVSPNLGDRVRAWDPPPALPQLFVQSWNLQRGVQEFSEDGGLVNRGSPMALGQPCGCDEGNP